MTFRFVLPLSDTDLQALMTTHTYGKKPALRRRAHAIVLSHQGHTINQICNILSVTRETVSLWFDAWEAQGLEGLSDKPRTGRPSIYSDEERGAYRRTASSVESDPGTTPAGNGKMFEHHDDQASLKKLGYSFKRARQSLKDRRDETDFRHTQGLLAELQRWEARGEADLYYFDESGFSQSSVLPYAWGPVGYPRKMPAYSRNQRLNVLGFLSRQGKLIYHSTTDTVTTEVVIEAFDHFITCKSPDTFAIVVMDNASVHRSALFQRKRQEWLNQRIYVIYLSSYSPELNLIEILWRKVKYERLPLTAYESFHSLRHHVQKVLSGYGREYRMSFV